MKKLNQSMATNVYAKGRPVNSDKDWYHGELTRDQAEEALRAPNVSASPLSVICGSKKPTHSDH